MIKSSIALAFLVGSFLMVQGCSNTAEAGAVTSSPQSAGGSIEGSEVGAPSSFGQPPAVGTRALCPVMKNEFVVGEGTQRSEYNGKHYAFCCSGCKPMFDADPGKYAN